MNKNFITLCKIFLAALLVALVACPTTSSETSKSEEGNKVQNPLLLLAHALDSLSKDLNVDKDQTSSSNLKSELKKLAKELEDQKDLLVKTVPDKTQFAAGLMMLALGAAQHDKDAVVVGLGYVVAALIDDSALDQWIKGTYEDKKKDLSGEYTANPLKKLAAFKTVLESLESDSTSENALNKAILKAAKTTLQRALARSGDTGGIMTTKSVEKTQTLALAGKVASAERTRIAKALVEVAKAALTADASPDAKDLKKLAEHVSLGTVVINLKKQLTVAKEHAKMPDALTALKNTLKAPNGADKDGALVTALSTALKTVVAGGDLQTAMTLALVALKVTDADTTKLEGLMVAAEAAGKKADVKSPKKPKKTDVLDAMTKVSAVLEELATLLSTALPKVPSVTL